METDVTHLLMRELNTRKSQNKRYSQRAFARDLELSPGFLSQILKKEKNLSVENALEVAKKLSLTPYDSQVLVSLVRYQAAQSETERNFIRQELLRFQERHQKFEQIHTDQFAAISQWYHLAILELIDVVDFSPEPPWIAARLGISLVEASEALDRLIRLEMIRVQADGTLEKTKNNGIQDTPSEAIRKFHHEHLKKATEALEKTPHAQRSITGLTVAIDPDKMPQACDMIQDFHAQLSAFFDEGTKKRVYQFAVQLFPLDLPRPTGESRS